MNWKEEYKHLFWIVGGFIIFYFLPVGNPVFQNAVGESLALLKWYAQEHVLLCLVPAFFIAGVISVFVSQAGSNQVLWCPCKEVASIPRSFRFRNHTCCLFMHGATDVFRNT